MAVFSFLKSSRAKNTKKQKKKAEEVKALRLGCCSIQNGLEAVFQTNDHAIFARVFASRGDVQTVSDIRTENRCADC